MLLSKAFFKLTDGAGRLTEDTESNAQLKCEINLFCDSQQ